MSASADRSQSDVRAARNAGWLDGWNQGRRALMLDLLRAEAVDASRGVRPTRDSALAELLAEFEEHLIVGPPDRAGNGERGGCPIGRRNPR